MEDVNEYRQKILDVLLSAKDDAGNPRLSEEVCGEIVKRVYRSRTARWHGIQLA